MIAGSYFGFMLSYFVVWTGVFTSIMLAAEYHVFRATGSVSAGRTILAFWGLMIFLVQLGAWICTLQLNSPQTFEVSTKDRTFANARIMRSSSSGFLIYSDEKVTYIPSGEIKSVTASAKPWP
jgi:hypothetical protein